MQKLVLPMKRILLLLLVLFSGFGISAWAQTQSTIRISVGEGAKFLVDGQQYTTAANFIWPTGSKHILQFLEEQPSIDAPVRYGGFSGWIDNKGVLHPPQDPVQKITAN